MNNPYNQPPQGHPPQGHPQPGYPPQQGYPPQGQPQPGFAQPGFAPPGYPQPGFAPSPGYEFSAVENTTIGRTATWAKAVGVFFFIQAALGLLDFNIIGIAIDLAIGLALWKGGKSMQGVVDTQGNDVPQMMEALEQMSSAFTIRLVLVGIAVGILVLAGIALAVFLPSM